MTIPKFLKGNITMSLGADERRLMLDLLEGFMDPKPHERFLIERLVLRMKGHRVEGTKWDKGRQEKEPCPECDNYYYPHMLAMHRGVCRSKARYDTEMLERI